MKAVATGDEIAFDFLRLAVFLVADFRTLAIEAVDRSIGHFEFDFSALRKPCRDQVFDHFLLAVNRNHLVDERLEIDAPPLAVNADIDAFVNQAFLAHARADTEFVE